MGHASTPSSPASTLFTNATIPPPPPQTLNYPHPPQPPCRQNALCYQTQNLFLPGSSIWRVKYHLYVDICSWIGSPILASFFFERWRGKKRKNLRNYFRLRLISQSDYFAIAAMRSSCSANNIWHLQTPLNAAHFYLMSGASIAPANVRGRYVRQLGNVFVFRGYLPVSVSLGVQEIVEGEGIRRIMSV